MKTFSRTLGLAVLAAAFMPSFLTAQSVGGVEDLKWRFDGSALFEEFGHAVDGAGDVDRDGFDDIIVGAWGANQGFNSAAGAAFVYSGATGAQLYRINGSNTNDQLGFSVAGAGDLDGDGFSDFLVGSFGADPNGVTDAGSVLVYSGRLGNQLFSLHGASIADAFGYALASAGDVNADGTPDFIVGSLLTDVNGFIQVGSAFVYSGATSALLYRFDGEADFDDFSFSVDGAGDVNGDGFADLIVGSVLADPNGSLDAGSAFVYSGATGLQLYRFDGAFAGDAMGSAVAGVGDVNGDGFDDIAVGALSADPNGVTDAGSVFIYSGATGAQLYRFDGTNVSDRLGLSVDGAGDADGDGFSDFLIGDWSADPNFLLNAGSASVYSGATGAEIFHFDGTTSGDFLGRAVAAAGDIDGDGRPDFILGSDQAAPNGRMQAGSAFVYNYNPILNASANTLSVSAGGTIDYTIDFPDTDGRLDYRMLLSLQGTGPTSIRGLLIPLSMDNILMDSLHGITPAQGLGFQGMLSVRGQALAHFTAAPGSIPLSLVGRSLFLAVVNSSLDVSSVARKIDFVQ
ncbi:MAG: integrin alpha [Planctomycetota bacterium]